MNLIYKTSALFITLALFFGCSKENEDNLSAGNEPIITANRAELNKRVIVKNEDLVLQTSGFKSASENTVLDYNLRMIAEVLPPVYNGDTLQASHIIFQNDLALVAYNTKGEKYLGGFELFDLQDVKNPQLLWSAVMPGADFHSLDYKSFTVFLAGAQDIDHKSFETFTPAFLMIVKLDTILNYAGIDTVLDLNAYAATDVRAEENRIYATSGSNGYFKAFDWSYNELFSAPLENARSVDYNSKYICVLQGMPGRIQKYRKNDFYHYYEFEVGDAMIAASKSEVELVSDFYITALNEGGVKAFDFSKNNLFSIAKPETPAGKDDANFVTNSVTFDGKYLYIANGGAGIHVYCINDKKAFDVGKIQFSDASSSNFVATNGKYLFSAAGKGGLKIVKITSK